MNTLNHTFSNLFRVPLFNGMYLTFSRFTADIPLQEEEKAEEEPGAEKPKFSASVEEMKEISVALLYYKAYLQQKGQEEKAEKIKSLDNRIYSFIQTVV